MPDEAPVTRTLLPSTFMEPNVADRAEADSEGTRALEQVGLRAETVHGRDARGERAGIVAPTGRLVHRGDGASSVGAGRGSEHLAGRVHDVEVLGGSGRGGERDPHDAVAEQVEP